jgi:hypothetical protein
MQIGKSYSTATPRIALIESSRPVCWIRQERALAAVGEAGADADPFVFLAHADQARAAGLRERPQHTLAGHDVGHRDDEGDVAGLDLANDAAAGEAIGVDGRIAIRRRASVHHVPRRNPCSP